MRYALIQNGIVVNIVEWDGEGICSTVTRLSMLTTCAVV